MAASTPRTHGERSFIQDFNKVYLVRPDADPAVRAQHAAVMTPAETELNDSLESHRAASNNTQSVTEHVNVCDAALDKICERIEATVKVNFGAAARDELFELWGHQSRAKLVVSAHLKQAASLEEFVRRLPSAKLFTLDPAVVNEMEAAIVALREAVAKKAQALTDQTMAYARLTTAIDAYDAAWSRMVKFAAFTLGDAQNLYVPDLNDYRRKAKAAVEE